MLLASPQSLCTIHHDPVISVRFDCSIHYSVDEADDEGMLQISSDASWPRSVCAPGLSRSAVFLPVAQL